MSDELEYVPTEAAFVSDLSVRDVQKAFDEGWFGLQPRQSANRARRGLGLAELLHLRVIKDTSRHIVLLTETKRQIHEQLRARMSGFAIQFSMSDQGWSSQCSIIFRSMTKLLKEPVRVAEISIDTQHAWQQMIERLAEITAARLSVVSDPDIRGGEPVVRGTRIPVHLLASLVEQGATTEEILSDYPALDAERLRLSLRYAQHHPRLGRPKQRPWQGAEAR